MNSVANRAAHLAILAASGALWAQLPESALAEVTLFQGVVIGRSAAASSTTAAGRAVFQGQVIDGQKASRSDVSTAAQRALGLALPAAGVVPRDVQRSRTENQAAAPRVGISIGIAIGGSSRSGARIPARLGPKR